LGYRRGTPVAIWVQATAIKHPAPVRLG